MKHRYNEHALVVDLKLGLPEAVDVWYKSYHKTVTSFVSKKIDHTHDVDEIVRETFLNCLRQLPLFQEKSSLKTWMLKIASHEIADYYRRKYAKKIVKSIPLSTFLLAEDPKNMHETSEYVVEVLHRMRADYSELLMLKYVDQISVKEIARRLQRSIKSIEADLFRARKEFRELYATMNL